MASTQLIIIKEISIDISDWEVPPLRFIKTQTGTSVRPSCLKCLVTTGSGFNQDEGQSILRTFMFKWPAQSYCNGAYKKHNTINLYSYISHIFTYLSSDVSLTVCHCQVSMHRIATLKIKISLLNGRRHKHANVQYKEPSTLITILLDY